MRLILLSAACLAIAFAQAPTFDVASVKPTNRPELPSFPLDSGNAKTSGGRFSASLSLSIYILFRVQAGSVPVERRKRDVAEVGYDGYVRDSRHG